MSNDTRPSGVTLLAALYIIAAIILLGLTILILIAGSKVNNRGISAAIAVGGLPEILLVLLVIALIAVAYGFIKGQKWSWWLVIILQVVGIIYSIISSGVASIIPIIISAIIIYYLTRPAVKKWFH